MRHVNIATDSCPDAAQVQNRESRSAVWKITIALDFSIEEARHRGQATHEETGLVQWMIGKSARNGSHSVLCGHWESRFLGIPEVISRLGKGVCGDDHKAEGPPA